MPNGRLEEFDIGQVSEESLDKLLHRSRPSVNEALRSIRRPQAALGIAKSPLGDLLVALGARGLLLVHYLPSDKELAALIARLRSFCDPVEDRHAVQTVGAEVKKYLAGEANSLRQKVGCGHGCTLSLLISRGIALGTALGERVCSPPMRKINR